MAQIKMDGSTVIVLPRSQEPSMKLSLPEMRKSVPKEIKSQERYGASHSRQGGKHARLRFTNSLTVVMSKSGNQLKKPICNNSPELRGPLTHTLTIAMVVMVRAMRKEAI